MVENDRFLVTNIRQYLNSDNPKLGEDKLIQELSEFSCPQNSDIEHFLKKSAIEPIRYISCLFLKKYGISWIFYHSVKAADSSGRKSKQYNKKENYACQ